MNFFYSSQKHCLAPLGSGSAISKLEEVHCMLLVLLASLIAKATVVMISIVAVFVWSSGSFFTPYATQPLHKHCSPSLAHGVGSYWGAGSHQHCLAASGHGSPPIPLDEHMVQSSTSLDMVFQYLIASNVLISSPLSGLNFGPMNKVPWQPQLVNSVAPQNHGSENSFLP